VIAARQRAERRSRIIRTLLVAGLGTLAVWFFFLRPSSPSSIDGHTVESFSTSGAGQHLSAGQTITYPTKPPVSGEHAPQPAPCGVHDKQIPDEEQVHTLEHGSVGIQFSPDLDPAQIKSIEDLVATYQDHVFSAPYSGMDTPIAVTSWGHMMKLDSFDETAIKDYIEAFQSNPPAPEIEQPCPNTADTPFAATPSGSTTPSPEASPSSS
jgi:hypothetical protein